MLETGRCKVKAPVGSALWWGLFSRSKTMHWCCISQKRGTLYLHMTKKQRGSNLPWHTPLWQHSLIQSSLYPNTPEVLPSKAVGVESSNLNTLILGRHIHATARKLLDFNILRLPLASKNLIDLRSWKSTWEWCWRYMSHFLEAKLFSKAWITYAFR